MEGTTPTAEQWRTIKDRLYTVLRADQIGTRSSSLRAYRDIDALRPSNPTVSSGHANVLGGTAAWGQNEPANTISASTTLSRDHSLAAFDTISSSSVDTPSISNQVINTLYNAITDTPEITTSTVIGTSSYGA